MAAGSAADLARCLGIPVLLVVNTAKQSQSIAALVRGFRDHRPEVRIAGVILNKVGSIRHEAMLRKALAEIDLPVLGAVPRDENLVLPERHLGLVQAGELDGIEAFVERAAGIVENTCDLDDNCFSSNSGHQAPCSEENTAAILPLGQRIAIARDRAFSFIYPHLLNDWKKAGVDDRRFFHPSPMKRRHRMQTRYIFLVDIRNFMQEFSQRRPLQDLDAGCCQPQLKLFMVSAAAIWYSARALLARTDHAMECWVCWMWKPLSRSANSILGTAQSRDWPVHFPGKPIAPTSFIIQARQGKR